MKIKIYIFAADLLTITLSELHQYHTYTANGFYTVTAEILYKDMFTRDVVTKKIEVKHIDGGTGGGGSDEKCCIRSIDREVEKDGNSYTKQVLGGTREVIKK